MAQFTTGDGKHITIHSSRRRFAARLNSGVMFIGSVEIVFAIQTNAWRGVGLEARLVSAGSE